MSIPAAFAMTHLEHGSDASANKKQPGLATRLPDAYNSVPLLEREKRGGVVIDPRGAVASHTFLVQDTAHALSAVLLSADIAQRVAVAEVNIAVAVAAVAGAGGAGTAVAEAKGRSAEAQRQGRRSRHSNKGLFH
jgi:hypothetical protein